MLRGWCDATDLYCFSSIDARLALQKDASKHLAINFTKSSDFPLDGVSRGGPYKQPGMLIVLLYKVVNFAGQFADGFKRFAS